MFILQEGTGSLGHYRNDDCQIVQKNCQNMTVSSSTFASANANVKSAKLNSNLAQKQFKK
jgi:hypothetical protein